MRDSHRTWKVESKLAAGTGKSSPNTGYQNPDPICFTCSARKLVTEDDVSPILKIVFLMFFVCSSCSYKFDTCDFNPERVKGGLNSGPFLEICLYTA